MASVMNLWQLVVILLSVANSKYWVFGESIVPCYFIFGDSLADPGNNNLLVTMAKANYPPYGVDFPTGATGRFSNGRTYVDVIAKLLGFDDYIPPFIGDQSNILKGVNYASGASGILDESGKTQGGRFSLNAQLLFHKSIVLQIAVLLNGTQSAANYLNKCIYSVGIGSNDYVNNYFMPEYYASSRLYNPDNYAAFLIQQYSLQLKALYDYGARKVALFGLGLLGFTPYELSMHGNRTPPTVYDINNAAELFNGRLKLLVDDLNRNLSDAKFIFINATSVASGTNTTGMNGTTPCCIVGRTNFTCQPFSTPCPNRSQRIFFDNIHPAEAFTALTAQRYYDAQSPTDAYPYDIAHLARL